MFNSNSAWNWWDFVHNIMHECDNPLFYRHLFCKSAAIICQQTWSALFKNWLLWYSSNGFLTVIRDHAGWSLTGNRKQNSVSHWDSSPKSGRGRGRIRNWGSCRLRESFWNSVWLRTLRVTCQVVAFGRWSLSRSGRYERVDCVFERYLSYLATPHTIV